MDRRPEGQGDAYDYEDTGQLSVYIVDSIPRRLPAAPPHMVSGGQGLLYIDWEINNVATPYYLGAAPPRSRPEGPAGLVYAI